jgi:hypothetical protein
MGDSKFLLGPPEECRLDMPFTSRKVNWYRTSHHLGPAGMSTPPPTPHWHLLCGFPEKNSELV